MIVITGASHDDVLYFGSVLMNRREDTILGRYKVLYGTLFNQDAMVVHGLYTSVLSSAVISHILDNNFVDLVINVGKCLSVENNIPEGDIAISSRVIDANIDLSLFTDVVMGQIPTFDRDFEVQKDILHYLNKGMQRRSFVNSHNVTFLTSDNMSYEMIEILKRRQSIFGIENENVVIDYNSAGIALACTLKSVPFISIKVVENRVDRAQSVETYSKVLDRYIDLGKAVMSTINDIGRNDILEGEFHG